MLSLQSKNRSNFHTIPKWIYIISPLAFFCSLPSASYFDISVLLDFMANAVCLMTRTQQRKIIWKTLSRPKNMENKAGSGKSWQVAMQCYTFEFVSWRNKEKWNIKIHHVVWSERLNGNACACLNQQNFLLHLPLRKMRWKSSETNRGLLSHHFHKTNIFFCWRFSFRIISSAHAIV